MDFEFLFFGLLGVAGLVVTAYVLGRKSRDKAVAKSVLLQDRLWRIRRDLSDDRLWLAKEFPDASDALLRALQMDAAYARPLGTISLSRLPSDIYEFRELLRERRRKAEAKDDDMIPVNKRSAERIVSSDRSVFGG